MDNTTDAQLIRLAAGGDRLAAGRLAERSRNRVFQIALQALGNGDDAADVAQETLVYALLRIGDLRDPNTFSGWLRQVTLSHCVDYRRRRGTRRLGEPIAVLNEASEESRYLEQLMVREALSHLSAAHRTALLLHYEGGWSLEETASLLQVPLNTVRSRLMAAKRHLRADLQIVLDTRKTMLTETSMLTQSQLSLVYDCYPFVHTGFVEQFLWRRGVSKREFAPRLAIKGLQMIARDLPVERPEEGEYWDSLRGWVEQALSWM